MTAYPSRVGKQVGQARIIDESAFSDGTTAQEILNFRRNERGNLDNRFFLMRLVPPGRCYNEIIDGTPDPFSQDSGCLAICYTALGGEVPEMLFLTDSGVFRYAPWLAMSADGGLEEQLYYTLQGTTETVQPQVGVTYFPAQWEAVGNRIYFTFCDGGQAWVWDADNKRLRPFGFAAPAQAPDAEGPGADTSPNSGGFSTFGRIGTTDGTFTDTSGHTVGGLDDGEWHYYAALEGPDGAYSAMSARGGAVTLRLEIATGFTLGDTQPEDLCRRWRVFGAQEGEHEAVILLRTPNLKRLANNDDGRPRFLHRLVGGYADTWIDDIPDGELGPVWQDREVTPRFYLLRSFSGSLFMARSDGAPARVWWSEQENVNGPTPESIMKGHWRDVYPNTGPITALYQAQFGDGQVTTALLVMKEQAVHFLTGQYPDWQIGTLSNRAGCAGPNLIATVPDGTVIWYGARTFWRLTRAGNVEDIGVPIRKRLRRVNYAEAKLGSAFVDKNANEVIFSLPMNDDTTPSFQFVWDYIAQGWRTMDQVTIYAALEIPTEDLIFIAGRYRGEMNVFAWDRGAYNSTVASGALSYGPHGATFQSGWVSQDKMPRHTSFQYDYFLASGEESFNGAVSIQAWADWNMQDEVMSADAESFTEAHPEDPLTPFWMPDPTGAIRDGATFDDYTYRERRPYGVRVGVNAAADEVVSLELNVSAGTQFSLVELALYADQTTDAGARTARVAEAD